MSESHETDPSKTVMELPTQALDLAGLVEYANASVVSRTLLDIPTGSMTAFAFDAGQRLREHRCPYEAVAIVLDGALVVTIGGEEIRAGGGQLVRMPANVPHAVAAEERCKMLLIMMKHV